MQITKLSTKGQIVIPESMRRNLKEGTPFVITMKNDLIVLKIIKGLTRREIKEMEELDKTWKQIDTGKCNTYSEKEFFNNFKKW